MPVRPLDNRVLVTVVEAENKTPGGLYIPDSAQEKPSEGIVAAAGPGSRGQTGERMALDLNVGDRIIFGKWAGVEVKHDGNTYLLLTEGDVLAIVTD